MAQVYIGTEIKLLVTVDHIQETHLENWYWEAKVYTTPKSFIEIKKSEGQNSTWKPYDENSIILLIDTSTLSPGALKCQMKIEVEDGDFPADADGNRRRTEIAIEDPGIELIKAY